MKKQTVSIKGMGLSGRIGGRIEAQGNYDSHWLRSPKGRRVSYG